MRAVKKEVVRYVNVSHFSLCTQFELEICLHCLGKPPGHWLFMSRVVSCGGRGIILLWTAPYLKRRTSSTKGR